ncbi:helix-turn-helix transcriptional regulator [Cytobacillus firmus]|nr:helix-turn-helix transcriptional regulator [Cytobacillus firmus]
MKKTHKALSEKATSILTNSSVKVICKLGQIMADRSINQTELATLTGLRQATINAIVHNTNYTINKEHLMILMLVLKLDKITDLYEVVFDDEEELKQLQEDKHYNEMNGLLPEQEQELALLRANKKATQ